MEKSRFELALVNFGECVKHMENSIGLLRAGDNREALCEARALLSADAKAAVSAYEEKYKRSVL